METVLISLYGGLVRTRQEFAVGTTLDIRRRDKERSARGRVVWVASGVRAKGYELGFEILDPFGFWEVNFPPDRWTESALGQSSPP